MDEPPNDRPLAQLMYQMVPSLLAPHRQLLICLIIIELVSNGNGDADPTSKLSSCFLPVILPRVAGRSTLLFLKNSTTSSGTVPGYSHPDFFILYFRSIYTFTTGTLKCRSTGSKFIWTYRYLHVHVHVAKFRYSQVHTTVPYSYQFLQRCPPTCAG